MTNQTYPEKTQPFNIQDEISIYVCYASMLSLNSCHGNVLMSYIFYLPPN